MHIGNRIWLGGALLCAALLAPIADRHAWAQGTQRCAALREMTLDAACVTSADVVGATDDVPAYCRARATALPAISIEVRLPMEGWNGKYYQTGCGGFCGVLGQADAQKGFINAMGPPR